MDPTMEDAGGAQQADKLARDELMRGDPARYGGGVGLWPAPGGRTPGGVSALLAAIANAADYARSAQRHAVRCGLGGSALERALETQAQAAEVLEKRVRPEIFY